MNQRVSFSSSLPRLQNSVLSTLHTVNVESFVCFQPDLCTKYDIKGILL